MSINDPFKTSQPENSQNRPEGEENKSLEEKLRQEFLKQTFLVVEDDSPEGPDIVNALRVERSTDQNQKDAGVMLVTNFKDCISAVNLILSEASQTNNLMVILDINFPSSAGERSLELGSGVVSRLKNRIVTLKTQQPDRQINLNIIFNSSKVRNQEQALKMGGTGFSRTKDEAVSIIKEMFRKKLESSSS